MDSSWVISLEGNYPNVLENGVSQPGNISNIKFKIPNIKTHGTSVMYAAVIYWYTPLQRLAVVDKFKIYCPNKSIK